MPASELPSIKNPIDTHGLAFDQAVTLLAIQTLRRGPSSHSNDWRADVARLSRLGKDTVTKCIDELSAKGFLRKAHEHSSFVQGPPEEWPATFDYKGLAEILEVSTTQARRIMAREDFPVITLSPRVHRIRREDLWDWMGQQAGAVTR